LGVPGDDVGLDAEASGAGNPAAYDDVAGDVAAVAAFGALDLRITSSEV
jgi:hypothetical protein